MKFDHLIKRNAVSQGNQDHLVKSSLPVRTQANQYLLQLDIQNKVS